MARSHGDHLLENDIDNYVQYLRRQSIKTITQLIGNVIAH